MFKGKNGYSPKEREKGGLKQSVGRKPHHAGGEEKNVLWTAVKQKGGGSRAKKIGITDNVKTV